MRMIVIGASGLIGGLLMDEARHAGLPALGTRLTRVCRGLRPFDVRREGLSALVSDLGAEDTVVLLAARIDPEWVRRNPDEADEINVTATIRLADEALAAGASVLFVSSESVFDGERGGYAEDDAPNPLTLYARQKVAVETHLRAHDGAWCIVRTGWTVDPSRFHLHCPVEATYRALLGADARMATDNIQTLTDARETARGIRLLAERHARGIYHLAGVPPVRRSELAGWIKDASRHGSRMSYREISFASLPFAEPRPPRPWLNSAKLCTELNLAFRLPHDVVVEKVALLDSSVRQSKRAV